jgi:uncharacterized membrane protein
MSQKKNFFVKNNTLNKGNTISDNKDQNLRSTSFKTDILAEFASLDSINAEKLVTMAKKEQEHEHKMEELRLNMDGRAKRMGRICGLFIILAICFVTANISAEGNIIYALIFAFIGFGAVLMLNCKHKSSCSNCGNIGNNRNYKNRPHIRNEGQNPTTTNDNKDYKTRNRNYHNRYKSKQQ